ncbi:MAG: hypothetical protein ABJP70_04735 [Erythrobacter sp.]
MTFEPGSARAQSTVNGEQYDSWTTPSGVGKAQFFRTQTGYFLRFLEEADFEICGETLDVRGWPALEADAATARNLFENSIEPLIANHRGGMFLHGAAVRINGTAIAFLGLSRSGKTTLAGAFAKAGFPFLTEDAIDLRREAESYILQPRRSGVRLFGDSANYLLGEGPVWRDPHEKEEVEADHGLPFSDEPTVLRHIFVLGPGEAGEPETLPLEAHAALPALLPHSFVLDVEDRPRLKAHFLRLAELSQVIACHTLDYPRQYDVLPRVIDAVQQVID